jgi:hypothetical protein
MSTLGIDLDPLTPVERRDLANSLPRDRRDDGKPNLHQREQAPRDGASTDSRREATADRGRHSSLIRLFRSAMHAEPGTARNSR